MVKKLSSAPRDHGSEDGSRSASEIGKEDEGGYEGDDDDENDEDDAPVPDEAFDAAAKDEPSHSEDEAEEHETPITRGTKQGVIKRKPSDSQGEAGDDRVSLPAASFEEAAKRAARKGKQVSSSSNARLSSEYDSEDIIVAPCRSEPASTEVKDTPQPRSSIVSGDDPQAPGSSPPRHHGYVDNEDRPELNGGSSELSDLGATPEPSDPELVRLAREEIRRKLELCQCEGWCSCERYKLFYGSGPGDMDLRAAVRNVAQVNDKVGRPPKRKRASNVETEDHDDENVFENPSSSQSNKTSDSKNKVHEEAEGSDSELPSQTHLSERVLANEKFPESAMRSTINNGKRRKTFESKRAAKRARTEQAYSWDRGTKPTRPPAGWAGGEWVGGHYEVQDSDGEEVEVET
jgi:hypothetical protein